MSGHLVGRPIDDDALHQVYLSAFFLFGMLMMTMFCWRFGHATSSLASNPLTCTTEAMVRLICTRKTSQTWRPTQGLMTILMSSCGKSGPQESPLVQTSHCDDVILRRWRLLERCYLGFHVDSCRRRVHRHLCNLGELGLGLAYRAFSA